ncbi:MAG: hypothetical protein R6U93_03540 [Dehalococcoidia bacterium]|jgi:RNase P subunit RPR2
MRRGCIAIGKVECDGCHRPLKYGENYLVTNGEEEKKQRFCIDCCVKHGYTTYKTKKGKQIVSFLPEE